MGRYWLPRFILRDVPLLGGRFNMFVDFFFFLCLSQILKEEQQENPIQNINKSHHGFRFLVPFPGKRNQKQRTKENGTMENTEEIKTRAPQNCARVLSPAFYLLQEHKPGTGNAARVLYDRVIFYFSKGSNRVCVVSLAVLLG